MGDNRTWDKYFSSEDATRLFPSSALLRDLNDPNPRYNHATKRPSTVNSQRFHGMAGSRLLTPSGGHHGRALLSPNGRKQNDQFAFALVYLYLKNKYYLFLTFKCYKK